MFTFRLKQILSSLLIILSAFLLAISIVIVGSPLIYKLALKFYSFDKLTGLTNNLIYDNFHTIIEYLINPQITRLEMPNFTSSENGLAHFSEVKILILFLFIATFIGLVVLVLVIRWLRVNKIAKWMAPWFNLAIASPLILMIIGILFFDKIFIGFHQLFFNNQKWLFDPLADPIINVLPESIFLIFFVVIIIIYEFIILIIRFVTMRK